MMASSRPSFCLPYAHYALIYLDHEGKLKVDESASIKEQNSTIFTPEVRQNFLEILGERIGYQQPVRRKCSPHNRLVAESWLTGLLKQALWKHHLAG